jgi:hypothetical protein
MARCTALVIRAWSQVTIRPSLLRTEVKVEFDLITGFGATSFGICFAKAEVHNTNRQLFCINDLFLLDVLLVL